MQLAQAASALATRDRGLLRFMTCGSVDDGKSTLLGRLLYDSNLIFDDQFAAVEKDSRKHGTTGSDVDLALLFDGLQAEREQGITIDIGYRYFATPRRSFIAADAPGHEQYTRNMATAASNSDFAVILVDARKGILPQTKRHSYICSLVGIRHVLLAVNKIDLVGYSADVFERIAAEYRAFSRQLGFTSVVEVPISARYGDNIIASSARTPWYRGPVLLDHLEAIEVEDDLAGAPFRFPVQWINRPGPDFRGFAGTVASGSVRTGDEIVAVPSGSKTRVARIVTAEGDVEQACARDAVTLTFADEIDVSRGELLASPQNRPLVADQFAAHIIWMSEEPLLPGRSYLMRIGNRWVPASVTAIKYRVDINTLDHLAARKIEVNEIAFCNLSLAAPVAFDRYKDIRQTGAFILVDRYTNSTLAAGMIDFELRRATNIHREALSVDRGARATLKNQRPVILWFTGLSGAGKSTIANLVERTLHERGCHTYLLDGDNLRHGLNRDLGFTDADRVENIRRVGEVANLFVDAGLIVLCSFISPFRAERDMIRNQVGPGEFIEVFVDAPIETCMARDPKGLYAKARAGTLKNFTGVDSIYEAPLEPELRVETAHRSADECATTIVDYILSHGYVAA